jgi:aminopeptidase C
MSIRTLNISRSLSSRYLSGLFGNMCNLLTKSRTQMIQAGQPVFFGCDVGQFSDSGHGVMDTALFEYEVTISHL